MQTKESLLDMVAFALKMGVALAAFFLTITGIVFGVMYLFFGVFA